jgi:hypothetical protein
VRRVGSKDLLDLPEKEKKKKEDGGTCGISIHAARALTKDVGERSGSRR